MAPVTTGVVVTGQSLLIPYSAGRPLLGPSDGVVDWTPSDPFMANIALHQLPRERYVLLSQLVSDVERAQLIQEATDAPEDGHIIGPLLSIWHCFGVLRSFKKVLPPRSLRWCPSFPLPFEDDTNQWYESAWVNIFNEERPTHGGVYGPSSFGWHWPPTCPVMPTLWFPRGSV